MPEVWSHVDDDVLKKIDVNVDDIEEITTEIEINVHIETDKELRDAMRELGEEVSTGVFTR